MERLRRVLVFGFVVLALFFAAPVTALAEEAAPPEETALPVEVSEVVLEQPVIHLAAAGKTAVLKYTVLPADADNTAVKWHSSKKSVAAVNDGKVTAKGNGTAIITCTARDGSGTFATCEVFVGKRVKKVGFEKKAYELKVGKTLRLTPVITPEDAADKAISRWESSNPAVASVANGKVKGLRQGTAKITAFARDGSKKGTCKVRVKQQVTGVTVNKKTLTLLPNKSAKLKAAVLPADAANKKVTWTSSNPAAVSVGLTTGKVTALQSGKSATITATTEDGKFKARCKVRVGKWVTGISLKGPTGRITAETAPFALKAKVKPADAMLPELEWSSSRKKVATVDQNGNVTLKGVVGEAVITAKSKDGSGVAGTWTLRVEATQKYPPTYYSQITDLRGKVPDYGTGCYTCTVAMAIDTLGITTTPYEIWKINGNTTYITSWAVICEKKGVNISHQTLTGLASSKAKQIKAAAKANPQGIMLYGYNSNWGGAHMVLAYYDIASKQVLFNDPAWVGWNGIPIGRPGTSFNTWDQFDGYRVATKQ